ncbi:LVIVD repeat-containing protein [Pelobacter seleniigenes]|uniref:LVIVD repeat-containing protein n=1 Tax=Pelobacter seleniigenes TaxID=407188 RepID=UPI0004A6BD38|nr:hypothetical protein [Pelobacter seleniigenes]
MKISKLVVLFLALAGLLGAVLVAVWYWPTRFSQEELSLTFVKAAPMSGGGSQLTLDLTGTGFDRETSVNLLVSIDNNQAVVGSFPLPGIFNESLVYGHMLYLGSNNDGLKVLDLSNPRQPRLLGDYLAGRRVVHINRSGELMFVAHGKLGVSVMKIQPDGLLTHAADIPTRHIITKTIYRDGLLYAAAGDDGLLVFDVTQLSHIHLVKQMAAGEFITDLAMSGDFLFLVSPHLSGLKIIDLRTPERTKVMPTFPLAETPRQITFMNDLLYVATSHGISVFAVESAGRLVFKQHLTDFVSAEKLFFGNQRVYISDSSSAVRILDLPRGRLSDGYLFASEIRSIAESGDYLYVVGSNTGILIVESKALIQKSSVKLIDTPGDAHDILVRDGVMYVADGRRGVALTELAAAGKALHGFSSFWGQALLAKGDLLFVAHGKQGIGVYDLSRPRSPVAIGRWPTLPARQLAMVGRYLVVANGIDGLSCIDYADIEALLVRDSLSDLQPLQIYSSGSLLYVTTKNKGLAIFELSTDGHFMLLSTLNLPFPMNYFDLPAGIEVAAGIAYIADGRSGLLVVDVSQPGKPEILASMALPGESKGLLVSGGMAYVISGQYGVTVVDIQRPAKPRVVGRYKVAGLSRRLAQDNGYLYLTRSKGGVLVVPLPVPAEKIELISNEHLRASFPAPTVPGAYDLQVGRRAELVIEQGYLDYP